MVKEPCGKWHMARKERWWHTIAIVDVAACMVYSCCFLLLALLCHTLPSAFVGPGRARRKLFKAHPLDIVTSTSIYVRCFGNCYVSVSVTPHLRGSNFKIDTRYTQARVTKWRFCVGVGTTGDAVKKMWSSHCGWMRMDFKQVAVLRICCWIWRVHHCEPSTSTMTWICICGTCNKESAHLLLLVRLWMFSYVFMKLCESLHTTMHCFLCISSK